MTKYYDKIIVLYAERNTKLNQNKNPKLLESGLNN
ncbi:hypothetical protein FB2170_17386 [Maribacter sp. HTCC2170]|nr:hypothetical protein FB2170_17386 [Maribacter sp. HTCC2170]